MVKKFARAAQAQGRRQGGGRGRAVVEAPRRSQGPLEAEGSGMANVLVVAEQQAGTLKKATLHALGAGSELARRPGGKLHVLVLGKGVGQAGRGAPGVRRTCSSPTLPSWSTTSPSRTRRWWPTRRGRRRRTTWARRRPPSARTSSPGGGAPRLQPWQPRCCPSAARARRSRSGARCGRATCSPTWSSGRP